MAGSDGRPAAAAVLGRLLATGPRAVNAGMAAGEGVALASVSVAGKPGLPDRARLAPEVYRGAEVFEPVWCEPSVPRLEAFLVDSADNRARGYGLLNWGDGPDAG